MGYSTRRLLTDKPMTSFSDLQGISLQRAVILLFSLLGLLQLETSPDTPQQHSKVLLRLHDTIS